MVTIITVSGSPIMIDGACDARMQDGSLVCFDAADARVLAFDPLDVTAFAIETEGREPAWYLGGAALLGATEAASRPRPSIRFPRLTYR